MNSVGEPVAAGMVQIEHVRAWLGTSLGHLLMSITLSPPDQAEALMRGALVRLDMPRRIGLPPEWIDDFHDRYLELLYNARVMPDGRVRTPALRVGQGEEWREHWAWLSRDIQPAAMLEAVQLAAGLMRCMPLIEAFRAALLSGDAYLEMLAVAVIRRWALTLKTMAWLEQALAQPWTHVHDAESR